MNLSDKEREILVQLVADDIVDIQDELETFSGCFDNEVTNNLREQLDVLRQLKLKVVMG